MVINELNLKNFGIVKESSFNFPKGINLISGENGQGKSTLYKAISYMLINYTEKTIKDYCNWDADDFHIDMKFNHLNKLFSIAIDYDRSDNSASKQLIIEGEDPYIGSDATKKLATIFDPILCQASILSFQGKLPLIESSPSERRENLKKLYNLDYKKQAESLSLEIKDLEDKKVKEVSNKILILENKEYDIKKLLTPENSEEDILLLTKDRDNLKLKIDNIIDKQNTYNITLQNINIKNLNLDKLNKEYNLTVQNYTNKNLELEKLEQDFSSFDFLKRKTELENQLNNTNWEENLNKLQNDLSKLVLSRVPSFNEEEFNKILNEYSEQISITKRAKEKIIATEQGICSIYDKPCPYVKSEYKIEFEKELEESELKEKELSLKHTELIQLKDKISKIETENNNTQNKINLLKNNIENELKNIEVNKENLRKLIIQEDQNIDNLKKAKEQEIENCKQQKIIYQNNQISLNDQIKTLEKEFQDLSLSLGEKPEINENDNDTIEKLNKIISNYNSIIETNKVYEKNNEDLKKQKEKDIEELESLKKEKEKLLRKIDNLNLGRNIILKDFPNFIIKSLSGSIETGINNIVDQVYDGAYKVKMQENKNGFDVLYGKRDTDIKVSSGFEKELFNLGYKNAFSEIADLGILFLDEIDSYASEKNSEKIFKIIGNLTDKYEQIFIITHKLAVQEILMRDFEANVFSMNERLI